MQFTTDCHMHTNTSADAKDDIDAHCRAAIAQGLERICFTNHYEIFPGDPTPEDFLFDFNTYRDEVERAREKFGDRLEILKGVEFGAPHLHPREYEMILGKDFDMIIASVHFLPLDFGIHWFWAQKEAVKTEAEAYFMQKYYEEMGRLVAVGGFDVLAHFDWPKRTGFAFREDPDACREIFTALLKNDAVLEINTSAYRYGFDTFFPAPSILSIYRDAGGNRLTIGSDAHCADDVGAYFQRAATDLGGPWEIGYFKDRAFVSLGVHEG